MEFDKEIYSQIIKKISLDEGIEDLSIDITLASKKGDNYLGKIYRASLIGKKNGHPVKLNLILKAPTDALNRETVPTQEAYLRENFFYDVVLRELENLQESKYVDLKCKFSFVKCFHTHNDFMEEMLILEDLKEQGFTMADRLKSADFAHCSLFISALGKLHALSYVMKNKKPDVFNELTDKCSDILCNGPFGKSVEKCFTEMAKMFVTVIKNEKIKAKVEIFAAEINKKMRVATKPNRFSVLGHGDCWINNMLFKYQDSVPVDVRLLDFQLMRYGSPALDILYFIFSSTDHDFRSQHYSSVLEIYYNTLAASLKAHSLDVEEFMTRDEFYSELEKHSDFGLGMAMLTLRSIVADPDDATDYEATMKNEVDVQKVGLPTGDGYQRFLQRANDVAEDYVDYGYLH